MKDHIERRKAQEKRQRIAVFAPAVAAAMDRGRRKRFLKSVLVGLKGDETLRELEVMYRESRTN